MSGHCAGATASASLSEPERQWLMRAGQRGADSGLLPLSLVLPGSEHVAVASGGTCWPTSRGTKYLGTLFDFRTSPKHASSIQN